MEEASNLRFPLSSPALDTACSRLRLADLGLPAPAVDGLELDCGAALATGEASPVQPVPRPAVVRVRSEETQEPGPAPLDPLTAAVPPLADDSGLSACSVKPLQNTRIKRNLRLPFFDLLACGIRPPSGAGAGADASAKKLDREGLLHAGLTGVPEPDRLDVFQDLGSASPVLDHAIPPMLDDAEPSRELVEMRGSRRPSVPVETITPPYEKATIDWRSIARVMSAVDSPPTDSDNPRIVVHGASPREEQPGLSLRPLTATGLGGTEQVQSAESSGRAADPWLRDVLHVISTNLEAAQQSNTSIKILSHALPYPSPESHAFPHIIQHVHERLPESPSTHWINVFHAVPGTFNMQNLPQSPPSTPGQPFSGQDYFSARVFDSAVAAVDYTQAPSRLTMNRRSIVPPRSVDVSIVERYIPPPSTHEFEGLFDLPGTSLLVDRLVELNPQHGSLVFIYPTKTGGRTFANKHLGPILDPLLRSIVVVGEFSSDLSTSLGRLVAAPELPHFTTVERNLRQLCHRLSSTACATQLFHGAQASFSLDYAKKHLTHLPREQWSPWFEKQEKPRMRQDIEGYWRRARRIPTTTKTALLEEVLDGLKKQEYPEEEPTDKIEIGVYIVVRRA